MTANVTLTPGADDAAIAQWLGARLAAALAETAGDVAITVPGGSTPFPILALLAAMPLDWARIVVWPGDERLVAEDHTASNVGRLRAALGPSGSPVTGSLPPLSIRIEPALPPAPPPPPRPNPPPFWSSRFGCQAASSPSCSGNAFGSPASLNASMARIADAVWWPWPPPWGENRVMTTSGRKLRITRTMSATTPMRSQIRSVSAALLE